MTGADDRGRATTRASEARRLALKTLQAVEERGAFINRALDERLRASHLGASDRALATELVYGVTRWRARLDYVLDHFGRRPVGELPVWIRYALRLGLYQLLYLDRVPARAAVSESVALAREFGHRGTAGLVNAVLRQAAERGASVALPPADENPIRRLAIEHSHPEWLIRRWFGRLGPERTVALAAADNEPAPLTLRANVLRVTREDLIRRLAEEGVAARPGRLFPEAVICRGTSPIGRLAAHRAGLFTVQDQGAMSVAKAVAPKPGARVIDACAGLGGKTTHLAEIMGNRGRVVALDLFEHKLSLAKAAARRLGLTVIETRRLDACELAASDLAGWADAVLVDAPCSGLGVLRRRPDLRWRVTPTDLAALAGRQREILAGAATGVRPGGVLVYATCSLEPEENEEVIEGFLASNLEFEAGSAADALGLPGTGRAPGETQAPGWEHGSLGGPGHVLLTPDGGTDGFFVARLIRRGVDRSAPAGSGGHG